jgi:ATP:corrinoid adenosyltransferase
MCDSPTIKIIDTRDDEIIASVPIQHEQFEVQYLAANKIRVFLADEMRIPVMWLRMDSEEVEKFMGWTRPYA